MYKKQEFKDGKRLSAAQLNLIEQGIVDVENAIAWYYLTLSAAIADINAGTTNNTAENSAEAAVKVYTSDAGILTVMLLADVSEDAEIVVNKSIDMILNGHVLSFTTADACLNFAEGTECRVLGSIAGSAIVKENFISTEQFKFITAEGKKLIFEGGEYRITGDIATGTIMFRVNQTCDLLKLDGCQANMKNTSVVSPAVRTIQCLGKKLEILNSQIDLASSTSTTGIYTTCDTDIKNSTIFIKDCLNDAYSENASTSAIANYSGTTTVKTSQIESISAKAAYGLLNAGIMNIENSDISAAIAPIAEAGSGACGLRNNSTGTITIENSTVFADAPGDSADEESATGIMNSGIVRLKNTAVTGTLSGLQNNGGAKLYVSGGTFKGYSHGGFYFAHGADGIAYINDATIKCGEYDGEYPDIFAGDTVAVYGGFYVGGGPNESNSNMSVYLDGCTIDGNGGNPFIMRNTAGESNNTVYISNSTLVTSGLIRIDREENDTNNRMFVGVGTNITEDKISVPAFASFTSEIYRKHPAGAMLNNNDYNALAAAIAEIKRLLQN